MHGLFDMRGSAGAAGRLQGILAGAQARLASLRHERRAIVAAHARALEASAGKGALAALGSRIAAVIGAARGRIAGLVKERRQAIARFIGAVDASRLEEARKRIDDL